MSAVSLALLVVVGLTSLGAYGVGTRRLGLRPARLRRAGARTLDCLGLAIVFLLANLAIGVMLVLVLRALRGRFISLYVLNDVMLPVLSLLQALVFQWWWDRRE